MTTKLSSKMSLFHVQDADRPMYVFAPDWGGALAAWRLQITKENPDDYGGAEVPEPDGIALVASTDDVIVLIADQPPEDITVDVGIPDGKRARCDECRIYYLVSNITTCEECSSQLCETCGIPSRLVHPHSDMGTS